MFLKGGWKANVWGSMYSDDDSILIVTHGSPYRALRYLIRKEELKGHLLDGVIDNCQCEEFEYK